MPYRQAVEVCKRFRPSAPSHVNFQKCTNQVGEEAKKVEVRCLDKNQDISHLSFQIDGGRINTKDGWRETKTAIVENSSDLIQMTKIQEHDKFMDEFTCIIEKQGYDKYPVNKALISDGAKWIGDDFAKAYPRVPQVLDYPHLKEHFFDAAKVLFGENETEKNTKWVKQHLDLCFKDEIKKLLAKIERARKKFGPRSKKREALRLLHGYVKTNQHRITYKTFEAMGLPIGSGRIEATIKQMNSPRLKSASIKWRTDNAQKILALRSTIFNKQFMEIKVA